MDDSKLARKFGVSGWCAEYTFCSATTSFELFVSWFMLLQRRPAGVLGYAADFFRVLFAASDVSDTKGIDTLMAVPSPPD